MIPAHPSPAASFSAWIDRCQRHVRSGSSDPGGALARLVADLPRDLQPGDCRTARRLLDEAWNRFLDSALPATADGRLTAAVDVRVARAIVEIETRFGDPACRLQTVAKRLGVSNSRLTQLIKQTTGETFGRRLQARRIAEARALLASSSLSVKEIATRVGYTTTSQLDRHFRKMVGCMPSAFRSAARAS